MSWGYAGIFNVTRITTGILITILVGMNTGHSYAATLGEMQELYASQKPGTVVVCKGLTEIHIGQAEPIRIEDLQTGIVLENEGDRMVFDVTYTRKRVGEQDPFSTERYRLTTTLEKTRQKIAIDPQTIELSFPHARSLEEKMLAMMKEQPVFWEDYSVYRITTLLDYQILPRPEKPDEAVTYCTNRAASQK
ncbi:hypothetical protein [Serratia sp. DD3]|uniref:hypothetical protein n=1 Tax=Serratia sp. DD3 TaxID=1410619 RepID=UPI0004D5FA7E|nr:hypothetical protein [Serratia sp. DD3]KEY58872.1 hypothetical protein SRDD_22620 [Serratia sp. DD3]